MDLTDPGRASSGLIHAGGLYLFVETDLGPSAFRWAAGGPNAKNCVWQMQIAPSLTLVFPLVLVLSYLRAICGTYFLPPVVPWVPN